MPFEILLPLWKSLHCIVLYDSESLSFLGPKIWEMLPLDLKNSHSLDSLKSGIKNWRPQEWPCRLCKKCIHQVAFTQITK